jgi:membrane protein DedA with SNARE-associated domain
MFFEQVIIPVLLVAAVSFWAGTRWEREKHVAQMKEKPVRMPAVRKLYRKNGEWYVQ